MKTLVLDTTTKKLQMVMSGAAATSNPSYVVTFADKSPSASALSEGNLNGTLNGTTPVDVVPAPAASTIRNVPEIVVKNVDTAAVTIYFQLDDNGTTRPIKTITLAAGATWEMSTQTAIDGVPGDNGTDGLDGNQYLASVRCSVVSGDPNPTTDQSAKTSIYVMEYNGGNLPLWDGTKFVSTQLGGELTAALSATYQTAGIYDVYVFDDSGTLRAGFGVAWSSGTSRGTGAGTAETEVVNGVRVNKNSMTVRNGSSSYTVAARRGTVVGTINPYVNGQIEWTKVKRGLCNEYNQIKTHLHVCPGYVDDNAWTSFVQSAGTFTPANGGTGSRVDFVLPSPQAVQWHVASLGQAAATNGTPYLTCLFDATALSAITKIISGQTTNLAHGLAGSSVTPVGMGAHFANLMTGTRSANVTFYVDGKRSDFGTGTTVDIELTWLDIELMM